MTGSINGLGVVGVGMGILNGAGSVRGGCLRAGAGSVIILVIRYLSHVSSGEFPSKGFLEEGLFEFG